MPKIVELNARTVKIFFAFEHRKKAGEDEFWEEFLPHQLSSEDFNHFVVEAIECKMKYDWPISQGFDPLKRDMMCQEYPLLLRKVKEITEIKKQRRFFYFA